MKIFSFLKVNEFRKFSYYVSDEPLERIKQKISGLRFLRLNFVS